MDTEVEHFFQALQASPLGSAMGQISWVFPTLETLHVIAISLVVGTIAIIDLRLLGAASRNCAVTDLSHAVLPWTWGAFVVAVATGSLMFLSNASQYFDNIWLQLKLAGIVAAGLNMAVFQFVTFRNVSAWDRDCDVPVAAKLAGTASLAFWVAVVVAGRWIGFTLDPF